MTRPLEMLDAFQNVAIRGAPGRCPGAEVDLDTGEAVGITGLVPSGAAEKVVRAPATGEDVVAVAAIEVVVAATAIEQIRAIPSVEVVVAFAPKEGVVVLSAIEVIIAVAAVESVIA